MGIQIHERSEFVLNYEINCETLRDSGCHHFISVTAIQASSLVTFEQ